MRYISNDESRAGTKSDQPKTTATWWERASMLLIVLGLILTLLWGGLIVAALAWFVRFLLS